MQQSLLLNGIKTKLQTYTSKNCFIIKLKPWLIENISTITLIYLASPLLPRCVQVQYIGVGLTWLGLCVWRLLAGMEGCCGVQPRRGGGGSSATITITPARSVSQDTEPCPHTCSYVLMHAYAYSDISVACECYFCTNQPHKTLNRTGAGHF